MTHAPWEWGSFELECASTRMFWARLPGNIELETNWEEVDGGAWAFVDGFIAWDGNAELWIYDASGIAEIVAEGERLWRHMEKTGAAC